MPVCTGQRNTTTLCWKTLAPLADKQDKDFAGSYNKYFHGMNGTTQSIAAHTFVQDIFQNNRPDLKCLNKITLQHEIFLKVIWMSSSKILWIKTCTKLQVMHCKKVHNNSTFWNLVKVNVFEFVVLNFTYLKLNKANLRDLKAATGL